MKETKPIVIEAKPFEPANAPEWVNYVVMGGSVVALIILVVWIARKIKVK